MERPIGASITAFSPVSRDRVSRPPAEISALHREGANIVGTPLVPEVIFAREAELCFASIAPVIKFGAGMAPAVVHFGPGSMNETNCAGGLHETVEKILRDAFAAMPDDRSCACRHALSGSFHGERPDWLKACSLGKA